MLLDLKGWKINNAEKLFKNSRKNIQNIIKQISKHQLHNTFSFLQNKNEDLYMKVNEYKKYFQKKKNLIVIGTGGSSLGSKALLEISGISNVLYLENIDPVYIEKELKKISNKSIGVLVISKSGETTETLLIFNLIMKIYKKTLNFKKDYLIITEDKDSTLSKIAKKNNIKFIEHEKNIGGRYSCFSMAGIFPMSARGLCEKRIRNLVNKTYFENLNYDKYKTTMALTKLLTYMRKKKYKGHVVLAYSDSMKSIVQWYRQLWAESLGKKGKGLHFIQASGAVDQHSQLQMWLDGPNDLVFTVIIPKKRKKEYFITDKKKNLSKSLKNKKMGYILNTMAEATIKELISAGRQVRVIYLKDDSIDSAIKLMATLMLEVPILCKALNINAFDQPEVEKVKLRTKKLLNNNA